MEHYLERCLSSLIVSNKELLEVIVVNDGSKDNSSRIAHTYQKLYGDLFVVIDKENGNYGSCINKGLEVAKGKYIKVLDSDDYFDSKNLALFLNCLQNVDVDFILTDYSIIDGMGVKMKTHSYSFPVAKIQPFDQILGSKGFKMVQMHAVTYKRQILQDMHYKQTEGIPYTDQEWIFFPMSKVHNYLYLKLDLYQYLVGRQGQTVDPKIAEKNIPHNICVFKSRLDFYKNNKSLFSNKLLDYYDSKLISDALFIYRFILLKDLYNITALKNLDDYILASDNYLYNALADSKFLCWNYIKIWRNNRENKLNSFIPFIYNLMYKIFK